MIAALHWLHARWARQGNFDLITSLQSYNPAQQYITIDLIISVHKESSMTTTAQNVLFLVTGMTPAIITETIWALACDPTLDEDSRWIPDRVEVLSTEHGLNQIRSRLIEKKAIEQMKQDFPQLANMVFDDSCMQSIKDEKNLTTALIDLKTPEDNEFAANQINERIRQLTQDENTCLHVSIAGGRKTMGFYAGYALSLHGRAQDRMSHVLVDDKFENIQDFLYPTPQTSYVTDRDGRVWDANKAQVWLAEIPFVRMKDAINEKHQLKTNDSFSEVISKIKNSFSPTHLVIDLDKSIAVFNSTEVKLPPREFAFLHWFADLRANKQPGLIAPRVKNTDKKVAPEDADYVAELTQQFAKYYSEQKSADLSEISVDKTFFNSTASHLRARLNEALGLETCAKFPITNHNKRGQPFYLDIPASAITIVDSIK